MALSSVTSSIEPWGSLPREGDLASRVTDLPVLTTSPLAGLSLAHMLPGISQPEARTCVAESWQAITGPDALLPEEYLRLPTAELQPLFESDLRALADARNPPRERCRLAHYLGLFSGTPRGACMYAQADWYVPTLYGVVEEINGLYASGQARLRGLWTFLRHVTAETRRSRGALQALVHALGLLTVLDLANMGRTSAESRSGTETARPPSLPPSLLVQLSEFEASLTETKLCLLEAASLVLQYSHSKGEVCGATQSLGLFEVMGGEGNAIMAEGAAGWHLFVGAGGLGPVAAALAGLEEGKEEGREEGVGKEEKGESLEVRSARRTDRLSILSFLTDLGPAHATLILPMVGALVRWAGKENPDYAHERTFALLSLARFLAQGKDGEDARFAATLGLYPVLVRRLQGYRRAVIGEEGNEEKQKRCACCQGETGGAEEEGGGEAGEHGELLPAALGMLVSLLLHSPETWATARTDAVQGGPLYRTLNSLLHEALHWAPEPMRSIVSGLVVACIVLLVHPVPPQGTSRAGTRTSEAGSRGRVRTGGTTATKENCREGQDEGVGGVGDQGEMVTRGILTRLWAVPDGNPRSSSVFSCVRETVRYRRLTCASPGVWRLMVHVLLVALMVIHPREVAEEGKVDGGEEKAGPETGAGALRAREEFTDHAALDAGVQYLASAVVMGAEGRKEWEEVRATFWADGTAALLEMLQKKNKDRGGLMLWGPGGWEGLEGVGGGGEGSVCGMCGISAEMLGRNTLLRCARCRRVRYCSKGCQVWHWKKGGHREACQSPPPEPEPSPAPSVPVAASPPPSPSSSTSPASSPPPPCSFLLSSSSSPGPCVPQNSAKDLAGDSAALAQQQ
ncbi:Zinc finger, MYND-type [Nannochloropsis gaditana]|uniref:Zinc finger, MYND-type n=1 Tax=Nannochloropsis gaditana TaxID=72520 RepID=W7U2A1_9STRA|nr:Zinc finger, MYND-type [Nannochloropsis gaditana]